MKPYLVPGLCLLSFMLADPVGAAERVILGKRFLIRDPSGSEANRVTMVLAKEKSTDVPGIVGDPIANGATLRITTTGTNPTDEFFGLNSGPGYWTATSSGFVFRGGPGESDPIVRAILKRTSGGTAVLKVVLKGSIGTRSLDVVPPNPGTAGTVVLSINNGGDRFCGSFGGVAGGTVDPNSASAFKIRNPTGQPPCPPDPPQLCCDFPFMQQCAWADNAEECVYFGGNPGDGNSVCDSVTGLCTTPPAQEGYCCGNLPTVFGTNCGAGPTLSPLCTDLGGTLFSSAVCTPAGTCASPSGAFVDSAAEPF